jgi:hypothetical protein
MATFQQAFDKAIEVEEQKSGQPVRIDKSTAKTLSFFWNMMALSGKSLDDLSFISKSNSIISVPLSEYMQKQDGQEVEAITTKGKKSSKKQTADEIKKTTVDNIDGDNPE